MLRAGAGAGAEGEDMSTTGPVRGGGRMNSGRGGRSVPGPVNGAVAEAIGRAKYVAVTQAAQTSLGRYQEFDSPHGNLLIPTLPPPSHNRS